MKSQRKILLFFIIIFSFSSFQAFAWRDNTHKRITLRAAEFSQLGQGDLMLRLNLDKGLDHERLSVQYQPWFEEEYTGTVSGMMQYGAVREDTSISIFGGKIPVSGRRFDNHFHNPLRTWQFAGLDDWVFLVMPVDGDSSLLWAQNSGENRQEDYPGGDNSWLRTREHYYNALVTESAADGSNFQRSLRFIDMFYGLGHMMHLLEDKSVPEHVRNDAHTSDSHNGALALEYWADNNSGDGHAIDTFALSPIFPTIDLNDQFFTGGDLAQIASLWDTDHYLYGVVPTTSTDWGLSEYTNSNFFSEDTIFTAEEDGFSVPMRHQFPYPRISSTNLTELLNDNLTPQDTTAEDGQVDRRLYVSKITHGETVNRFLASTYLEPELRFLSSINLPAYQNAYRKSFYRDERCHRDCAARLIPRAVGYAATLLDYFFRGRIEIALPFSDNPTAPSTEAKDDGVYAFTLDPAQGFQEITLMARNVTPDEEMQNGEVKLLIRYRICPGDPFAPNQPAPAWDQPHFQIVDPLPDPATGQPVTSIPTDWIKLKFDISSQPIPMNAMDLNFTLIFRGDLGFETETGVAIGFKDVSEPSPITIFNNSDMVCYNGTYVDWNDPGLFAFADKNDDGVIDCSDGDLDITPNRILLHNVSFNGSPATATNFNHQFSPDYELMPGQGLQLYVIGDEPPEPCFLSIETTAISTVAPNTCITWYPGGVATVGLVVNKFEWDSAQLPGDFYTHWISSFANFRGTYYHYLYHYANIKVPEGSYCPIDQLIIPDSREDAKKKSLLFDGKPIKQGIRRNPKVHGIWKKQRETNR
jgi:hypothetical protein